MNPSEVIIDGIRYVPAEAIAVRISIFYMFDNHTFRQLTRKGEVDTIEFILEQARAIALTEEGYHGGLCPACILDANDKELRRIGPMIHANTDGLQDPAKWEKALRADPDAIRLLAKTSS